MSTKIIRLGIVCVGLAFFGGASVISTVTLTFSAENDTRRLKKAYESFQQGKCESCHPAIWREWENSMHAKAWIDEIYQASAKQIPNRKTQCDPCHAPEPILITGISEMPQLRKTQREAGVSCLTCHIDAHGAMNGPPATAETQFHPNVTNPLYTIEPTKLCSTCHGQKNVPQHDLVTSFRTSKFAAEKKSCATCHMPSVIRLRSTTSYKAARGRKHTWQGSRSSAQLKRAAALHLEYVPQKLDVTLRSKTGHLLPGSTFRTIRLEVTLLAPDGTQRQKQHLSISAENRNRLLPNESKTYTFDIASTTAGDTIKARLIYQLTPKTPESEWIVMGEKTVLTK